MEFQYLEIQAGLEIKISHEKSDVVQLYLGAFSFSPLRASSRQL